MQRQLSDALCAISLSDFPERWPSLLPDLVAELEGALRARDIAAVSGVLDTAAAVFERFRGMEQNDATMGALKAAVDGFAAPLTHTFAALSGSVEEATAAGAGGAALLPLLRALRTLCAIFYLLNSADLPEYFEDHIGEWMTHFHKYLALRVPALLAAPEDPEEGPLEALQAEMLGCVALYAENYPDEFLPFQPTLSGDVWALLTTLPPEKMLCANMDGLVPAAMRLLASVMEQPSTAGQFSAEPLLRALMARIVLPNITLRAGDLELLEDNPADFIRSDMEGSDTGTRRRMASDLVRAMGVAAPALCAPIALEAVHAALAEYEANKGAREAQKDAAVALLMAVAIKTQTQAAGVTAVSGAVDISAFLRTHVLSELTAPPGERPLAKAACVKLVATFRSLFTREELHALLPMLAALLPCRHFVVHTYAAIAIERILGVRDFVEAAAAPGGAPPPPTPLPVPLVGGGAVPQVGNGGPPRAGALRPRVDADALGPLVAPVLGALFSHMVAPGYAENEYLMRAVMRVVVFARERCLGAARDTVVALNAILARVTRNPANPTFNHFMFESLASIMRSTVGARAEAAGDFEGLLFPHARTVLDSEVLEFQPYMFQLLALLLDLAPAGAPLSPNFASLLPALLTPPPWRRRGNVPALATLLCCYVRKGGARLLQGEGGGGAAGGALVPILTVWRELLGTKGHEGYAFAVLDALALTAPDALAPHLRPVLEMALTAVQASKAIRVASLFIHTAAVLCGAQGPAGFAGTLQAIAPGLLLQITDAVIAAMAPRIAGTAHRREAAVGLTRLLCEVPAAYLGDAAGQAAWAKLLGAVVELVEAPAGAPAAAASRASRLGGAAAFMEDEDLPEEAGDGPPAEYAASYSRLLHAGVPTAYAFPATPSAGAFLARSLGALAQQAPQVTALVQASPASAAVARIMASK